MDEIVRTQRAVVDEHPAGNVGGGRGHPRRNIVRLAIYYRMAFPDPA